MFFNSGLDTSFITSWRTFCQSIPRHQLYEILQSLNYFYYFCKWPDEPLVNDCSSSVSYRGVHFRCDNRGYWTADKSINGVRYWVYVGRELSPPTADEAIATIYQRAGLLMP